MMNIVILVIFFTLVLFITSVSSFYNNNNQCPKCGNINVPYPFSTSENCGNPNYKLHCSSNNNNNGVLQFSSADGIYYNVLSINPHGYRLIINPPHIEINTCLSSDLNLGGFRIDENSPFNISSRNTVMLLNCSENILLSPLNCSENSPCRVFEEKGIMGKGCRDTLCCSYVKDSSMTSRRIRVRVGGCTAYSSVVDMKPGDGIDSWRYGIELQWLPPSWR